MTETTNKQGGDSWSWMTKIMNTLRRANHYYQAAFLCMYYSDLSPSPTPDNSGLLGWGSHRVKDKFDPRDFPSKSKLLVSRGSVEFLHCCLAESIFADPFCPSAQPEHYPIQECRRTNKIFNPVGKNSAKSSLTKSAKS